MSCAFDSFDDRDHERIALTILAQFLRRYRIIHDQRKTTALRSRRVGLGRPAACQISNFK
jgi:hypothetical protein